MKLAAVYDRQAPCRDSGPSDGERILHIESCQPIGDWARRKITVNPAQYHVDISLDLGDPSDFEDDTLVYFILLDTRNRTKGYSTLGSNGNSPPLPCASKGQSFENVVSFTHYPVCVRCRRLFSVV